MLADQAAATGAARRPVLRTWGSVARYMGRRLLLAVPVVVLVSLITFSLVKLATGSYVPGLDTSGGLRPEDLDRIRATLGLDDPAWLQYARWVGGVFRGDLGRSMVDGSSVLDNVVSRLPSTVFLAVSAIALSLVVAIPVGLLGAVFRGRRLDQALSALSVAGFGLPTFWLAILLIQLFSVRFQQWGLPWLPSGGDVSPVSGGDPLDRLRHVILPATALAVFYIATWSRFVRSSMIAALGNDYVRTARAKGMRERRVVGVHALRDALTPLITLVALELPRLVSGALVIEVVFSWPGIGSYVYNSALQYDYTAVLGVTTFVAVAVIVGSLVADLLYSIVDPRVRYR